MNEQEMNYFSVAFVAFTLLLMNVSLVPIASAGTNLVANPGFESGTSPWIFYTNSVGKLLNDAPGQGSLHSGHVTISQQGTNVQLYQARITLEPKTAYRLDFKAYSKTGHDLAVTMQKHGSPYTSYGLSKYVVNLGTNWGTYSIRFTTSGFSGTVNDARLMFWLAPYDAAGDQYYFDDVVLSKASSITPTPATTSAPLPQITPATTSTPTPGTLLFDGTFESTDVPHGGYGSYGSSKGFGDVWNGWYCLPQSDSLKIVPAPGGRPGYAAKFINRPGYAYNCGGNQHNEIATNNPPLPKTAREVWYGWSQMLDPTWAPSNTWSRVGFGSHSKYYTKPNTGINFQFGAADTSVTVMIRNTWTRILNSHSKGVWHDWMFHIKWATDNTGFLEVYHKVDGESGYTKLYSRYNFQTQEIVDVPEDLFEARLGIYRGQAATSTQILYVLNPKIGTTREAVEYKK